MENMIGNARAIAMAGLLSLVSVSTASAADSKEPTEQLVNQKETASSRIAIKDEGVKERKIKSQKKADAKKALDAFQDAVTKDPCLHKQEGCETSQRRGIEKTDIRRGMK